MLDGSLLYHDVNQILRIFPQKHSVDAQCVIREDNLNGVIYFQLYHNSYQN